MCASRSTLRSSIVERSFLAEALARIVSARSVVRRRLPRTPLRMRCRRLGPLTLGVSQRAASLRPSADYENHWRSVRPFGFTPWSGLCVRRRPIAVRSNHVRSPARRDFNPPCEPAAVPVTPPNDPTSRSLVATLGPSGRSVPRLATRARSPIPATPTIHQKPSREVGPVPAPGGAA